MQKKSIMNNMKIKKNVFKNTKKSVVHKKFCSKYKKRSILNRKNGLLFIQCTVVNTKKIKDALS